MSSILSTTKNTKTTTSIIPTTLSTRPTRTRAAVINFPPIPSTNSCTYLLPHTYPTLSTLSRDRLYPVGRASGLTNCRPPETKIGHNGICWASVERRGNWSVCDLFCCVVRPLRTEVQERRGCAFAVAYIF